MTTNSSIRVKARRTVMVDLSGWLLTAAGAYFGDEHCQRRGVRDRFVSDLAGRRLLLVDHDQVVVAHLRGEIGSAIDIGRPLVRLVESFRQGFASRNEADPSVR